jgi:hypothetical protein
MSNVLLLALTIANMLGTPVLVLILLLLSYSACNSVIFLMNDTGDYGYNTMYNLQPWTTLSYRICPLQLCYYGQQGGKSGSDSIAFNKIERGN